MSKRATVEGTDYATTRNLRASAEWLEGQIKSESEPARRERLEVELEETRKRLAKRGAL